MERSSNRSIIINTGFRWAGEIVNKALWLGFIILLARKLGTSGFGYFNYAFSFAGLLVIFTDLGMNTFLIRKVARDKTLTGYYLSNILAIKCVVSFIVLALALFIPKEPSQVSLSVMLFSAALVLSSFLDPFNAIYRAHKQMFKETLIMLVWRFLIVGLSLIGLFSMNKGLNFVGVAFIMASAAALLVTAIVAVRTYGPIINLSEIDLKAWRGLLRGSIVLGALLIISGIFFKFNVILLQYLGKAQDVGWYSAAFKLIDGSFFVPSIFIGSLFPVLCEQNQNSAISGPGLALFRKSFMFLLCIAAFAAASVTVFADPLIIALYGREYLPAAGALKILSWSLVFIYVNELFTFFFLSVDRQKSMFKILVTGLLIYALLCVILIPQYGYTGAAYVLLITQAVITLLNLLLLKRS